MAFEKVFDKSPLIFCEVKDRVRFRIDDVADKTLVGTIYQIDYLSESMPMVILGADGNQYRGYARDIVFNYSQHRSAVYPSGMPGFNT